MTIPCICPVKRGDCNCLLDDGKPILSAAQRRFLAFHVANLVDRWRWHLLNSQLRAHVGKLTATLSAPELMDLIARGLMFKGAGAADVHATDAGRAAL